MFTLMLIVNVLFRKDYVLLLYAVLVVEGDVRLLRGAEREWGLRGYPGDIRVLLLAPPSNPPTSPEEQIGIRAAHYQSIFV